MRNKNMNLSQLVHSKEYGRGIIEKISPSKSIYLVRFKNFGELKVLSSSVTLVK